MKKNHEILYQKDIYNMAVVATLLEYAVDLQMGFKAKFSEL